MALSVKLYRVVGKGKDRRYIPIDFGRRGRHDFRTKRVARFVSLANSSVITFPSRNYYVWSRMLSSRKIWPTNREDIKPRGRRR